MAVALNLSSDRRSTGGHLSASNDRHELRAPEGDRFREGREARRCTYIFGGVTRKCHVPCRVAQLAADVTQVQYIPKGQ